MSNDHNLPIYFTGHSISSLRKRGSDQDEVIQVIRESEWREAKLGRLEAEKEFAFNAMWNGSRYQLKKVTPVFLIEEQMIIVVTVYCFYY